MEDVVHGRLKGGRGIRQAEGHLIEFVVLVARLEGHGFNGVVGHSNLVEAETEVEFGEESGMQFVKQLVNCRDGECVANGDVVEYSVVNTEAPGVVFFRTSNTGEEKGLRLGLMMPSFSIEDII